MRLSPHGTTRRWEWLASRIALRAACVWLAVAVLAACATTNFDGPGGDQRFYEARCGACHVPLPREMFRADEWPRILDEMAPRARLTRPQRERVFAYLTAR